LFRVYSPSFSLPYGGGLQHVDGVDPLQLKSAIGLIEPAIGVRAEGYTVVVPPVTAADAVRGYPLSQPAATQLAELDVKFVASEFDLTDPAFDHVQDFGNTRLYLNQDWTGRAWVEGQSPNSASVADWSPNRVVVRATGPGRLVLSEINYPGWLARVDGQPATLETAQGALRAVTLPAGTHAVTFEFQPVVVYAGLALSLLGLVMLLLLLWTQRRA
jgi:hypothetical protein